MTAFNLRLCRCCDCQLYSRFSGLLDQFLDRIILSVVVNCVRLQRKRFSGFVTAVIECMCCTELLQISMSSFLSAICIVSWWVKLMGCLQ